MSHDPEIIDRAMRKLRREQGLPERPDAIPLDKNLIRPEEYEAKPAAPEGTPKEPTWSDPSTWTLSMRLSPVMVVAVGCFIAIYYDHFFGDKSLDMTSWQSCMGTFDYGVPISAVRHSVTTLPSHSWEYGTAAEALLELINVDLSVFSPAAFPNDEIPPNPWWKTLPDVLSWANQHIYANAPTLFDDPTGVSDPASLGVSAVLIGQRWDMYLNASRRQKEYLLNDAPRYKNGAISHRSDDPELWSDAISMFPPFLAYFAVATNDLDLMKESVNQIRLYRDVLAYKATPRKSLWRHIVGTQLRADPGTWSTGNAWAAYGMARVRATITHWGPSNDTMASQVDELDSWLSELFAAVIKWDTDETGLLRNYIDDKSWFGEASGTALLAAASYRMAVLRPETFGKYMTWADRKRQAVLDRVGKDGIVRPVVNPLEHGSRKPIEESPEGQAFVLMLVSAWRDCVCARVCSSDISKRFDNLEQGTSARSEL